MIKDTAYLTTYFGSLYEQSGNGVCVRGTHIAPELSISEHVST
jgi:hypothetical protein